MGKTAAEGEKCSGSLPPGSAILCAEGLVCISPLPGADGVCKRAPAPPADDKKVKTAAEGEKCNPSLPPGSAILCAEGLVCISPLLGADGVCKRAPAPPADDKKVKTAAEGEKCN